MAFNLNHTSKVTKMVIIVEFLVVSYLLYTLTVSVYKSYQIDQHIATFMSDNEKIALDNKQKELDYGYYSSNAYVEKIAKQNLGLVKPGEQVIVIPSSDLPVNGADQNNGTNTSDLAVRSLSNPQKWWKFFFDIHA
ncbi:MAG: septum formation initiator family protein [Candidatus Gracilibacteria bacterium]|jgi:cell division protein FtsB